MNKKNVIWKVAALSALIVILALMVGLVVYLESSKPGGEIQPETSETAAVETDPTEDVLQPTESEAATEEQAQDATEEQVPGATEATVPAGSAPTVPEEPVYEDIAVETPYCTLYYSGKWEKTIQVEIQEADFGYAVVFFGSANNEKVYLFSVLFALETENSYPIGYYESEEGITLDVSVELSDFVPDDTWSDDAVDLICSMQEEVNHVIEKLSSLSGFHAVE